MLIGVDLDDVLADFVPALVAFHNSAYRTALAAEDFSTYRFWERWGGTREEAVEKVHHFYTTDSFRCLQPMPGAVQGIEVLSRTHTLTVITGRTESVIDPTLRWLEQYFSGKFTDVHCTNHYAVSGRPERAKSAVCQQLGVQLMIEDALDHAAGCVQHGIPVLLFDRPWNRAGMPEEAGHSVTRVFSWQEIIDQVDILALR